MGRHFARDFAEQANELLHELMSPTRCFRHEILEVPGLVTGLFITYDDVKEDSIVEKVDATWEEFLGRLVKVTASWSDLERVTIEKSVTKPEKALGGYEKRTIYLFRGGSNPEQWTTEKAREWVTTLFSATSAMLGPRIVAEWTNLDKDIAPGADGARAYEYQVRVTLNFLFSGVLGEFKSQSRTEDDGVEVRDLLARNNSQGGFWRDLKEKYGATEAVFELKNKTELNRDDLRQAYCYLKPALSLWGFVVCRSEQPNKVTLFNRTLFKNFAQQRGVLLLSDSDIRRMLEIRMRGHDPSEYLSEIMSEFVRSV